MKYLMPIALILAIITLFGCASTGFLMAKSKVTLFGSTYPAKSQNAKIDVYSTLKPDKEYVEIAQIFCGDTDNFGNMKQILTKAREVVAYAIIITSRSGSYGLGVSNGNMAIATVERIWNECHCNQIQMIIRLTRGCI